MQGKGKLVKIYLEEADAFHGEPLYHALVKRAKQSGLLRAVVLRGIEGFGSGGEIHSTRILRLSENLPVILEIADTAEKIEVFLQEVSGLLTDAQLVAVQDVELIRFEKPEKGERNRHSGEGG